MHSFNTLDSVHTNIKKKICILGGQENYKDEFQKRMSSNCLPIENKENIGVNISKIEYFHKSNKFEFLLWNIDCSQNRAFLRTTFYSGANTLIIFISDTKVGQIMQYFEEIHARLPEASLIFCIILEDRTKKEIMNIDLNTEIYRNFVYENYIETFEISDSNDLFDQISTIYLKKITNKEVEQENIINFIRIDSLFGHSVITDDCNEYYEPENENIEQKQLANTELLNEYIQNLELDIEYESVNWIKIPNKQFGTFRIYIKNGNVYYTPKICEKCTDEKCPKLKNAPYFICIETGEASGWTNIKGFNLIELLILTKIIALEGGNENNLPDSVLVQINNINTCEKKK
ncbi:MAG: hypothetical protein ACXAAI_09185 [Promethearchaeota archaeon]